MERMEKNYVMKRGIWPSKRVQYDYTKDSKDLLISFRKTYRIVGCDLWESEEVLHLVEYLQLFDYRDFFHESKTSKEYVICYKNGTKGFNYLHIMFRDGEVDYSHKIIFKSDES